MLRWARTILVGISLLLCLLTIVSWVWSYWYTVDACRGWGDKQYELGLDGGQIVGVRFRNWPRPTGLRIEWGPRDVPPPRRSSTRPASNWGPLGIGWITHSYSHVLGFGWATGKYWPPISWHFVTMPLFQRLEMPCWFLVIVTGSLPAFRIAGIYYRRQRNRRRQQHGLCPACGYDLRATPDRCPECGTATKAPA